MAKPTKKSVSRRSKFRKIAKELAKLPAYDPAVIEKKWQKKWASAKLYRAKEGRTKDKFYILDMFPYPSGEGLHVGHPKGYIATDVISRMKRMQGMSVLHPMGFDAFGLPAENYALKTKTNPADSVKKNVERYKKQLEILGFDYDWSREINTTDPAYYRWTQWIFLQMWKKGLAYESNEPINWCPSCKTGLANEDIEDGRCERCGTPVEKKPLRQWVLKITDYADRLLADLDAEGSYIVHKLIDKVNPHQKGKPLVERHVAHAIVYDPKTKKYLIIRNKKHGWDTVIIGGIEKGETPVETAIREIREETGYIDIEFKRLLGGQTEAHYYTKHKGENRIAYAQAVYFELKSDKRVPIADGEDKDDEILWIDEADFVPGKLVNSELPIWLERIKDPSKGFPELLLKWPESIKEAQRNWIGKSEGAEIDFQLKIGGAKTRFVILHGYTGRADKNFIPWLKTELEKRGHEVMAPQLPNTDAPTEEEQVTYVLENCRIDERTVLIGHSLGGVVAMKALMKLNRPVGGLVLVAPALDPSRRTDGYKKSYHHTFLWDYDFEQIKALTSGKIAILSDIQEDFRMEYLSYLSRSLSAALIETTAAREHFCANVEPAVLKAVTPTIHIFTTRPDTIYGVTYLVLAPEHPWVKELLPQLANRAEVEAYISRTQNETEIERTDATKDKTGVALAGVKAVNPANGEEVSVWIADYVLADYGTGAVMAVPAHDDRDFAFAKKFGLPIRQVIAGEFGTKRENEQRRNGGCGVIFDPVSQKYGVYRRPNGRLGLFGGGVESGEDLQQGIIREIEEESGLHDFEMIENIETADAHYFHSTKKVNRVARATCLLLILKSATTKDTKHEDHEDFHLEWVSPDQLMENLRGWNSNDDNSHWQRFIYQAVGRAIELGYDTTNDPKKYCMSAYTGPGVLINSGPFNGRDSESVKKDITASLGGRSVVRYKLRDWVFSRQRYWGEPIPLIHCEKCGVVAMPEKDLPVKLPKVRSYEPTGTGESPLAAMKKWVNVKCPTCKGKARRETNTMPQWAGSSWYYLRYMDPKNKRTPVSPAREHYWSPVDFYVGGAEHATRHLIYARFWHKFLYDIGLVTTIEPFIRLQSVGLIMGEDGRKMSKRFGNVVNPDDMVKTVGADSLRLYEMFMGPFDQAIAWSTDSIAGTRRFVERVWKLASRIDPSFEQPVSVARLMNRTIKKVSDDIPAMRFNTAISALMIALNELEKEQAIARSTYEILLRLLAPFAPHMTDELWHTLGNKKSIHTSKWPAYEPGLAREETVTIVLQINGKARGSFAAPAASSQADMERMAQEAPEAIKWLNGNVIKRIIVVPGRLVNIVTGSPGHG